MTELARLELAEKARKLAPALALGLAALVLALFAVGYGVAAAVEGLDGSLPRWAALLVVAGALAAVAALLGALAVAGTRRAAPPVPEQAIAEARETTRAVRAVKP